MMQSSSHLRLTIALRLAAAVFFLQGSINASLPSLAFVRINNNNVKTIICAGNGVRIDMTIFLSRQTRISFPNNNNPFLLNMAKNEKDYTSPMRQRPRPEGGDVAYINENILRQLRCYNNIQQVGGDDCIMDIYARDPNPTTSTSTTTTAEAVAVAGLPSTKNMNNMNEKEQQILTRYWFVGKVARCTGTVSPEQAVARQYNLLEEHACRIRPIELGRHFGTIELFIAPGNTEMLMSQNDPCIRLQKVPRYTEGVEQVSLLEVGLHLEIVTNQGVGFCIYRDDDDSGILPAS